MIETKPIKGGTTAIIKFTPKIDGVVMTAEQREGMEFTAKLVVAQPPASSPSAVNTDCSIVPPPCCQFDPVGWSRNLEIFDQEGSCTVMMTAKETYDMSMKLPGRKVRYRMMIEVRTQTTTTGEEYGQDLYIPIVKWAMVAPSE
jgi:hypothetical protein